MSQVSTEIWNVIISGIPILFSLASIFITRYMYFHSKRRENYQNLLELNTYYLNPDMHLAVQELWEFYRSCGETGDFIDKFIENRKEEAEKTNPNTIQETLDYRRKIVSHFYRRMSTLLEEGLIDSKLAYRWWTKADIRIVNEILIPIETRLSKELGFSRSKIDQFDYLVSIQDKFQ